MEKPIGGATVQSAILNILAENAYTLLVAASKEICARVMMKVLRCMFGGLSMLLRHDDPPSESVCVVAFPHRNSLHGIYEASLVHLISVHNML
jgi:hypothetical protein